MNSIIKTLLMRRSSEEGFIIPTVIALGLIMLLIGTINIFKSNDEHLTAIAQRDTREALTAAEAGVAFYREFIDKYKNIAEYNSTDAADEPSWEDRNGDDTDLNDDIPGIADNICDFNSPTTAATEYDNTPKSGWQNVSGGSGQYRLISYDYANELGTLVVEGRDSNSNEAATVRVRVEYPIQPGLNPGPLGSASASRISSNLNNFSPALWIGSETITLNNTNDNLEVTNGNIIVSDRTTPFTDCKLANATQTIADALGNMIAERRSLPATANPPDYEDTPGTSPDNVAPFYYQGTPGDSTDPPDPKTNSLINVVKDEDIKNTGLPRAGDNSQIINGENVYHYLIEDELNLADGDEIILSNQNGSSKIFFYVQGNITIDGNVNISCNYQDTNTDPSITENECIDTNASDRLEIYGNSDSSGSNQFGCATGVTCPTELIELQGNGNINIKAFIHAPDATVTVSNDPIVDITGAVWVEAWDDDTVADNTITIAQDGKFFDYSSIRTLDGNNNLLIKPIIYPSSNWKTEAVP